MYPKVPRMGNCVVSVLPSAQVNIFSVSLVQVLVVVSFSFEDQRESPENVLRKS